MEATKEMLDALNQSVTEFRAQFQKLESGSIAKSDFEAFKAQIGPEIIALKSAVSKPATVVPNQSEHKDDGSGKAEYRKAFYNGLRRKEFNFDGKAEQYRLERKALVADTTGQILIPEELESEVYRSLAALNEMRGLATVRTTASDRIRRRSLTEVTGGWGKLELGGTPTETTPVPSEAYTYVEDWNGLTKIGKDELMDSDQNIEAILADSFARAIADDEEDGFINGTGHTFEQPEGILLAASGVTCVDNAAAGAVTFEDLLSLMYAVPKQYRRNGSFIMHSGTELLLALLRETATGGSGPFLWTPSPAVGQPASIWGRPVYNCETMPQIGDGTLQKVAIFGDIKAGYRIVDRLGMNIQRLNELFAGSGMIGLLANKRTTGSVIRADAMRILQEHS
jgi:HK97 family phage major capsid protein